LVSRLKQRFGVPVHVGNQAELSALGQLAFATGVDPGATLVNLIVDGGIEMGVGMAGGAVHYGSDLGELQLGFGEDAKPLRERLAWRAVRAKVAAALAGEASSRRSAAELETTSPSYLRLRGAAGHGSEPAE